jgi:hypothetical protein
MMPTYEGMTKNRHDPHYASGASSSRRGHPSGDSGPIARVAKFLKICGMCARTPMM